MSVEEEGKNPPVRRVFRNQETRFMAGVLVVGPIFLASIVFLGSNASGEDIGLMILLVLVAGFFAARIWNQGIHVDDLGLKVRGVFTSRRLTWEQVRRFELRDEGPEVITYIDLYDGTSVPARALNAGKGLSPAMTRRAQVQVDELNAILHERLIP